MAMRSSGVRTTSAGPDDVRRNCLPSDNPDMASFSSNAPTAGKKTRSFTIKLSHPECKMLKGNNR